MSAKKEEILLPTDVRDKACKRKEHKSQKKKLITRREILIELLQMYTKIYLFDTFPILVRNLGCYNWFQIS